MNKKEVVKRRIRNGLIGLFVSGGLVLGAGLGLGIADEAKKEAADKPAIPEVIDINIQKACPDMEGLKKDIKEVDGFTHKAHIQYLSKEDKDGFVCAKCHHGAKTKKDILESDKCKRLEKEFEEVGGPKNFKKYFHDSCLKCHKTRKKEGKATGPVSCKGCHNRKGGKK